MIGYTQFIDIVSYLIRAMLTVYLPVLQLLWANIIKYGLASNQAYLGFAFSNSGYNGLYRFLYGKTLVWMTSALIGLAGLGLVYRASSREDPNLSGYALRLSAALIISASSLLILRGFENILVIPYSVLLNYHNLGWSTLPSIIGESAGNASASVGLSTLVLDLLLLSAYFVAIAGLFAILMIRQAVLLFLVLVVPFLTLLYALDVGKKYATMVWELIIEFSLFPFAIVLSLILAQIFSSIVPLNLAFLFLPEILPGYLMFSGRSLSSTPMIGFMGGLTLGNMTSRSTGMMSAAGDSMVSGNPLPLLTGLTLLPAVDYRSAPRLRPHEVQKPLLADAMNEELKYRKGYGG